MVAPVGVSGLAPSEVNESSALRSKNSIPGEMAKDSKTS